MKWRPRAARDIADQRRNGFLPNWRLPPAAGNSYSWASVSQGSVAHPWVVGRAISSLGRVAPGREGVESQRGNREHGAPRGQTFTFHYLNAVRMFEKTLRHPVILGCRTPLSLAPASGTWIPTRLSAALHHRPQSCRHWRLWFERPDLLATSNPGGTRSIDLTLAYPEERNFEFTVPSVGGPPLELQCHTINV